MMEKEGFITIMIDKDAQGAADRFLEKLKDKGFTISQSKNTGENYDTVKQKRDSEAVIAFTETKVFQDILKLK